MSGSIQVGIVNSIGPAIVLSSLGIGHRAYRRLNAHAFAADWFVNRASDLAW